MAFLKPLTWIILIIGYVGTVLCLQLPINRFADLHLWNFLPSDNYYWYFLKFRIFFPLDLDFSESTRGKK